MTGLLLILVVSLMLAYIIKRDIEEVLPPFVMTLMLGIYGTGILKKSHHAFSLSLCVFALIALWFAYTLVRRRPKLSNFSKFAVSSVKSHTGFILFLFVSVLMFYCYSTHFVNVWDDFHYNATFPKDCWSYGTMTYGNTSATYYKSYLPLQQLFFYWGFQSVGKFSEPMMFSYKMILIYVMLLPFFKKFNDARLTVKIPIAVFSIIMPFLFMFEVVDSLSMDTVMASFFAYAVINILSEKKRDYYCFYRIFAAILCLTLMKSIALMFSGITLGIWLFVSVARYNKYKDKESLKEISAMAVTAVLTVAGYFSWKIFCDINGNTVYLSEKLADNLSSQGGISLPSYGKQTIAGIIKSIFGMNLNLENNGLSLGIVVVIACVLLGIIVFGKCADRFDFWTFLILLCGLFVYIAFLCYTYCFLFEPWEAEGLSSLDRYFGTYAYVICYTVLYRFICFDRKEIVLAVVVIVLVISLPFSNLFMILSPSAYLNARGEYYQIKMEVQNEVEPVISLNLPKSIVMVVNDSENDMYSRSLDYELIPHISRPLDMALYDNPEEKQRAFLTKISDENPDYIYFSKHERIAEDVDFYPIPENYRPVEGVEGLFGR